nr:SpoIIE family protein phosphatase [Streptomyces chromofuscus]
MRSATVVIDPKGMVNGWSEGAQALFGWTPAEAVGQSATELLAVEVPSCDGFGRPGHIVTARTRLGAALDAELIPHPCVDGDSRCLGFLLVAPPVSCQSSSDEEIIRRTVDQAPFTCVIWDLDLLSRWTNIVTAESGHLEQQDELRGHPLDDAPLPRSMIESMTARLREVRRTGEPSRLVTFGQVRDEDHVRPWSISFWPVRDDNGRMCAIAHWGVDISAEYEARRRLMLLNEAGNAIGGTLDVEGTARELVRALVPGFADMAAVDLFSEVLLGEERSPGPFSGKVTLGRAAQRSTEEVATPVPRGSGTQPPPFHAYAPESPVALCLATGKPQVQLLSEPRPVHRYASGPGLAADPAHWPPGLPVIDDSIRQEGLHSRITVPLRARGTLLGVAQFSRRSHPEPFTADDLILAEDLAAKAAVALDNARLYLRERTTALTLQRSLLPRHLAGQAAVQVATRYLPADSRTGVGGDWFDVIPLSGGRVALVVGDVVGHGVRAAAAMGRLRTAVRTLAAVDLPPDELLTHLDDLVIHLYDSEEGAFPDDQTSVGDLGATCLYAVYDPVTRHCGLATAGHPLPVLVTPGSAATPVSGPVGPLLGLGGLPFVAEELELPPGSVLALFSDGLVESRGHDSDDGMTTLCRALEQPADSLEATCDAVLRALLDKGATDDVALLIARTRAFSPDQVATLDVPPDFAMVEQARKWTAQRLAEWDLTPLEFVLELVVSELVTNAIRYGAPPIQLRLIRDRTLICEVSDCSSTAPHLRRARLFDEGGRGLLPVAQLMQGWGTRHTPHGKSIWCEHALQPSP